MFRHEETVHANRWVVTGTLVAFLSIPHTQAAEITIFTSKTAWEAAVAGQSMTEDFSDAQINHGVSFVSSESGHINPALQLYKDVLSSSSQNEPSTIWTFSPLMPAFGGDWDLGGPGGSGNSLLVYLVDVPMYVGCIPNSTINGFWGFTSDIPFSSVRLVGGRGTHQQQYTLDNMVYSTVPEPAGMTSLLPGVGWALRRHRR